MILFIIFFILSLVSAWAYFFSSRRFSFDYLFLSLWLMAIGVAQWRLSPLENPWSFNFWLIILGLLAVFGGLYYLFNKFWSKKITEIKKEPKISGKLFAWILALMTLAGVATNLYIFSRFSTLPILSSAPDKMRFVINKEIFGVWEYLALIARWSIPLSFFGLMIYKNKSKWIKAALIANIVIGFGLLSLYASRLVIVFAVLISYFIYLIWHYGQLKFKQLAVATIIAVVVVLAVSSVIPAVRQFITYRDYYTTDSDPYNYLLHLSEIKIPKALSFVTPLYLVPVFNLQELMRASVYFNAGNYYYGRYELAAFNPLLKLFHLPQATVAIPWKQIFLPWWVTGTFLFYGLADFGLAGIFVTIIILALILSLVFQLAIKKQSLLTALLFAYFSFVVIMSIYTNYFFRPEFYLDLMVIFFVGLILSSKYFVSSRT